ncbi:lysostaphin resistance A-like protein [Candidatus Amarolinea aalborgensis]|jgi:membrane protease YdiL (CAAX protease family)|uniref:CPBP family intramembrane glutamic endopeptidase n=1 Tax=Candidatus Amarolinea aalborgensis TaxID=2249329 RepID=UPI003BF967A7
MVFLQFVPFIVLLLAANLAVRASSWRVVTTILLTLFNMALIFLGAFFLIIPALLASQPTNPLNQMPFRPDWAGVSLWMMATGVVAFLPLIPAVRRGLARLLPLDPASPVHMTALAFAVYLLGSVPIQLAMLGGNLDSIANMGSVLGLSELWQQGAAFIIMGLFGVGLWLRRSTDEVTDRLGLHMPSGRQWGLVIGLTIVFVLLDQGVAWAWANFDPVSFERIGKVSNALFGGLISPLGALTIGLSAGLGEELVFRGALQPRFGLLFTSFLFAVIHVQYGLSPAVFEVFLLGLVLGVIRQRGNLTMAIALHTLYNASLVALTLIFPGS